MKGSVSIILFIIALSQQAEGEGMGVIPPGSQALLARAKRETSDFIQSIHDAVQVAKSQNLEEFDHAVGTLEQMDPACRDLSLGQVRSLNSTSFWDFLKCVNFTRVTVDMGDALVDTITLVDNVTVALESFLGNFSKCQQGGMMEKIACYMLMMQNVQDLVVQQMTFVENYILSLGNKGKDIKDMIAACVKTDENKDLIKAAMKPAMICNSLKPLINNFVTRRSKNVI